MTKSWDETLRRQSGSPSSFLAYPGPSRNEYGYLAPNQLGYEPRKPIELAVGKAVFGSHVLPCDVAGFLQGSSRKRSPQHGANPTTGIAGCCARATSGHAATPPDGQGGRVAEAGATIRGVLMVARRRRSCGYSILMGWIGCRR